MKIFHSTSHLTRSDKEDWLLITFWSSCHSYSSLLYWFFFPLFTYYNVNDRCIGEQWILIFQESIILILVMDTHFSVAWFTFSTCILILKDASLSLIWQTHLLLVCQTFSVPELEYLSSSLRINNQFYFSLRFKFQHTIYHLEISAIWSLNLPLFETSKFFLYI